MSDPHGSGYRLILSSDVLYRDGVALELVDDSTKPMPLAEIFYSDADGSIVVTTFGNSLPLPTLEWMIDEVRKRLLPRA
jgi:hypothetical protein